MASITDLYGDTEHRHPDHVGSVILVRHGRTAYNLAGRFQGQVDIPLDETGMWQVRQTAAALKSLYVDRRPGTKQLVVCSDLSRAAATAHAFADPLGLEVHPDERVRERSFGDWEGVAVTDLRERYPEDYRSYANWEGGELNHGAERRHDVGARGVAALNDWAYRAGSDTTLFVFSHGAWISQVVYTLLGEASDNPNYCGVVSMRNAHWARLSLTNVADGTERWRLVDYNHGPAAADTEQWDNPAL
ncbi:histidine phosphatase family protein [Bifidobacterium avesanii]|uniref:Histidine phosphatase family protein n=1 Tax=Bifidobacterium avesanii TaxID=1798157 RepID=A0A7K3TFS7_9BIFI|nr:histidine phosphatase family protein [Bifidobacterium avesanii]KAB8295529.1 phosphoglycerate mutase [Bifidobacterium avesanii]NEG77534.1 histidine phosphatase family protein [Bifidobacterium avesanii]